jgi:hypothetical protein
MRSATATASSRASRHAAGGLLQAKLVHQGGETLAVLG